MAEAVAAIRKVGRARIPGAAYALLGLVALFAAGSTGFHAAANLANIGMQSTILLLLALPMTLIIMTEGIDLSMGAVLTLASVVLALVSVRTDSVALALAGALAVGAAFGLANGALAASGSIAAPLASVVAGGLADFYGPRVIFALMAVMVCLALALLPAVRKPSASAGRTVLAVQGA